MLFPNAENVRNTATCTLAYVYEVEHLNKRAITGIGNTAALCSFDIDTKTAGVGKRDNILLFDDDKTLSAVIVGIYQAVGKSFSECLVDGRIVNTVAAFELERNFNKLASTSLWKTVNSSLSRITRLPCDLWHRAA